MEEVQDFCSMQCSLQVGNGEGSDGICRVEVSHHIMQNFENTVSSSNSEGSELKKLKEISKVFTFQQFTNIDIRV
jgi:hypothetical protein